MEIKLILVYNIRVKGVVTMNNEFKSYKFQPKINRILSYFCLIIIPLMIIVLIYNFNVYAMLGIVVMSILVVLLCYWCNNLRIEIFDEKIINYGFKKHIFELKKIKSLSVEKRGFISLEYEGKIYKINGFISFLSKWCDKEKNEALVEEINRKIKKLKRWK